MGMEWFALGRDGASLAPAKEPAASKPVHWKERDVEHLLALNPSFLDVADQLPLRLDGGSTTTAPDQAFVDELGRVTIVELKKVTAGLNVIAQAIAYADHWRQLPAGEIDRRLKAMCSSDGIEERLAESAGHICDWAGNGSNKKDSPQRRSKRALEWSSLQKLRGKSNLGSLTRFAKQRWDCDRLPFIGAPARIILVAPDFTDECIEFAEQLSERMVAIELVRMDIVRSKGEVFIGRRWVHQNPQCEPTWKCLRRIWELPSIRDNFVLNGWADPLNLKSFSLSLKDVPDARFWFQASAKEGEVYTVVPDGWHAKDSKRKELREKFLDALPKVDRSERFLVWGFDLPDEQTKMDECLEAVAEAVVEVLHAERTRLTHPSKD